MGSSTVTLPASYRAVPQADGQVVAAKAYKPWYESCAAVRSDGTACPALLYSGSIGAAIGLFLGIFFLGLFQIESLHNFLIRDDFHTATCRTGATVVAFVVIFVIAASVDSAMVRRVTEPKHAYMHKFQSFAAGCCAVAVAFAAFGDMPCAPPEAGTGCSSATVPATMPTDEICPVKVNRGWTFFKPENSSNSSDWADPPADSGACRSATSTFTRKDKVNFYFAFASELDSPPPAEARAKGSELGTGDLDFFYFKVRFLHPFLRNLKFPFVSVYWKLPEAAQADHYYFRETYALKEAPVVAAEGETQVFTLAVVATANSEGLPALHTKLQGPLQPHYNKDRDLSVDITQLEILSIAIQTDSGGFGYHFSVEEVSYKFKSQAEPVKVSFK